ncbi:MAG: hypothetical protein QNJ84_04765 [Alphaproteobacteria bacterium]|nr:hypothetical protein [Alphaproteobacteria bacterium]
MFQRLMQSVFLTREGRAALEKTRRAEARIAGETTPSGAAEDLAREAAHATADAAGSDSDLRHKANATDLDRETIREALAAAHREIMASHPAGTQAETLTQTQSRPAGLTAPAMAAAGARADRESLVQTAMTIYRNKQKVLNELDPDARKKLRLMAKAVFGVKDGP